jgi:allene oxide cyclase-like protein
MMRRRLPLAILAVLALAVVIVPGASTSSVVRSSDDDDVVVIRVTETTVEDANLDLGEPGDSLGDQFIFRNDLSRAGKKVGIDGGVCTLVGLEPMVSATLQCVATAVLPRGQITVQGLVTFTDGPSTFELAITGGTGRFREAHGVLTIEQVSDTESLLTFRIIR